MESPPCGRPPRPDAAKLSTRSAKAMTATAIRCTPPMVVNDPSGTPGTGHDAPPRQDA